MITTLHDLLRYLLETAEVTPGVRAHLVWASLVYSMCGPALMDTPRPPALRPVLVPFGALAAVEFRGGAGLWPSGTSRTQQGGRRQEFFNHPVSVSLSPLSVVFPCCLVVVPSITHCLRSSFFYILQFKMQGSYGGISAYMQYTHRQACKHESETIKSTEAAETAGGGLWPHCTDWLWNNRAGHE